MKGEGPGTGMKHMKGGAGKEHIRKEEHVWGISGSGNSIQGPLSKRPDSKCQDSKGPGLKTSKIQTFFKSSVYSVRHKGLSSISFCT